jgi:MoaA/NifB/PqqE/SkfB family radical SAM enzyme
MDYQTIERVKNGINNCGVGPETIALMLTRVCNLRCAYCRGGREGFTPQESPAPSDELSAQELLEMLKDARGLGVKEINLGGMSGEPFCKKDIFWLLSKIKELGFVGSMTTNGFFLNREAAELLARIKWDILLLSFDSSDNSIHQRLRPALNGENYFPRVVEFLQTLDSLESGVRVLLNVVITRLNYRGFPDLVKFANSHKCIESINVLKLLNAGLPNYDSLQLGPDDLHWFRQVLQGFQGEKKIRYIDNWIEKEGHSGDSRLSSGNPGPGLREARNCFTNYYILSIDANGDIIKCPQCLVKVSGLNIRNTPLRHLWKNEHLLFRKKLAENADCFEGCCTILKEQNKLIRSSLSAGG